MRLAVRRIYERFFNGGLVLAAMTEDLPYPDTASCHAIGPASMAASGYEFSTRYTPVRSSAVRLFCGSRKRCWSRYAKSTSASVT